MSMSQFYFPPSFSSTVNSLTTHLLSSNISSLLFPISIFTMGENFSILLFLALSSVPWAQDKALCYRPYFWLMKIAVVKLVMLHSRCTFGPSWAQSLKQLPRWPLSDCTTCFSPYLWGTAQPHCRYRDLPRTWAHCRWCPGPWWQTLTLVPEGYWWAGPGPGPPVCKKPSLPGPVSPWHGCLL